MLAYLKGQPKEQPVVEEVEEFDAAKPDTLDLSWEDVNEVDEISLEVGYRLIPLVDKAQGGDLLSRIKGVRKKALQRARIPNQFSPYPRRSRAVA